MKVAFAAVCLLALAGAAAAQKGGFVAANIVPTWAECPVKKPTEWDPKVFDSSLDSLTQLTEYTKTLPKACQDSLLDLAGCASDNDAFADPPSTITSLSTSDGCCLSDCSKNIKKAIAQGCFNDLLKVICNDPKASKYKAGLFNAGARCADYAPACPAPGAKNATAAVKEAVANATAAATDAVANATAAAKDAVAGAAKDAVAKATGGAGAVAASAVMALAGAAALLAL